MKKLLSLLPLLAGCAPCEPVSLPAGERAWVAAYREGAQLTFRSNRGHANTFTVLPPQEWHENTNCNFMEAGRYQPIFSQLILRPATAYDDKRPDFLLNIRKNHPERPGTLTFMLGGLECTTSAAPGQPTSQLRPQPCTLASGKTYPAAYVFRHGQNATNYGNGRVQAVFWDTRAGLLRYELADGETFERVAD